LSVCCRATAIVLTQASFRNLRKVFSMRDPLALDFG
jgi:hypothetical protein